MKKKTFGPAMYYASDKNVFDALIQHRVDAPTLATLFERRNIIASKKTLRDDLAEYFSRLPHDYYDHNIISEKLGILPRRERTTSMDLVGNIDPEELRFALEQVKKEIADSGDVAHITRSGNDFTLRVQYSLIDYKKTEFAQLQNKDGLVEFIKTEEGYLVNNAQNDFMNAVRDEIVSKVDKLVPEDIERITVNLYDVIDPGMRTRFFIDLSTGLDGFSRRDVSDVYVYKPKLSSDDEDELASDEHETHIEKVLLKGNGVTRSKLLLDLVQSDAFHIFKMCWTAQRVMGNGDVVSVEVMFADPKDCTGFSILIKSVYPYVEGKLGKRRAPLKSEIDSMSRLIEKAARKQMQKLRGECTQGDE
ncbi:hypothetical protein [Pseudomonas sp. KB-10]|uniref:hypothetical protein n=1 Tax=Pseudomonas sp. KB-10 TaxID=2292264 RepID=UPI001BB02454|nr:hypothetical protein [Pseudomonas sp. KB-10]